QGDIRDAALLDRIFAEQQIDAVIHFAALKAVGESTRIPLDYYENNLGGTLTLLQAMKRANVHNLVFSSSATVYGDPASLPIREDFPRSATNPYGRSKLI
ncbi:NAD-dependent epimerase/dehydratase family protein, partial [Vibrio parahaemolyticus]|nr:NAD-dependent epimerase/dehydratase family protein [Vibrio parahaemolyticus]